MVTENKFKVGEVVQYTENNFGQCWVKIGTVVEIGEGKNTGRIRVLWDRWEWKKAVYEKTGVRKDGKRTWMKATRLQIREGGL